MSDFVEELRKDYRDACTKEIVTKVTEASKHGIRNIYIKHNNDKKLKDTYISITKDLGLQYKCYLFGGLKNDIEIFGWD